MTAVERARALAGVRFRPQGRRADVGLDCIGVVALTYGVDPGAVPSDYRLRGGQRDRLLRGLARHFRAIPTKQASAGDVLLCAAATDQLHLVVKTGAGFIHADAGLRRVVETPGTPPWPVLKAFRQRTRPIKE